MISYSKDVISPPGNNSHICELPPSDSQYALPPGVKLSDTFLPRQKFYDRAANFKIQVYNQGYGYRLSSRTGKLRVVVLLGHAFIALLGSL